MSVQPERPAPPQARGVPRPRPVAAPAGQPAPDEVLALAADNQGERAALIAATLAAVLATWSQVELAQVIRSWFTAGLGSRVFALVSASQESTASGANRFVEESFRLLGEPVRPLSVNPAAFAGIASDGRSLEGLLAGAPVLALQRLQRGDPPAVASKTGADFLRRAVTTQIADAGRAADQVAIALAEPERAPARGKRARQYGWVRMLNPPSCSRCIVLAGKFYRWNEGFLRHEMCDCSHIPAIEDVEDDLVTNPYAYFKSLSREQQDEAFGKANAQAIRDGADINQVVNATTRGGVRTAQGGYVYTLEGTTRRGVWGSSTYKKAKPGVLRPTPWQIYRDAHGDHDEAVRLLKQFRYAW